MIVKILIRNDTLNYNLVNENSVKRLLLKILTFKDEKITFLIKENFTSTLYMWINFLEEVGFKLTYHYDDDVIEFSNEKQNSLSLVILYLSICNYHFGRKSIIANVIWMKQCFKELSANEIFLLSLYSTRKPSYNKILPLVFPYNFKKSLNKTESINVLFKETKENFNHKRLKDAINNKNINLIKKLLK